MNINSAPEQGAHTKNCTDEQQQQDHQPRPKVIQPRHSSDSDTNKSYVLGYN
ncbi:hypothetical protein V1358_07345 [Pseudoalteromonas sp. YIC-656]|uniref:hypothetical protein n=1 Tax=Pseudoalteromonas pernae TaxID=3118054 RepID=UPI00324211F5